MLWDLFVAFVKIGFVSFGGGYAMIPVIEYEVQRHGWLTTPQFTDVIALAGMSPGPLATNAAVFVGFKTAGLLGAIIAGVGISLPSFLIIILLSLYLARISQHPLLQSAFYGLRPMITGLICYAAIRFAMQNQIIGGANGFDGAGVLIMLGALGVLLFTKIHPVFVILLAGVAGVMIYS